MKKISISIIGAVLTVSSAISFVAASSYDDMYRTSNTMQNMNQNQMKSVKVATGTMMNSMTGNKMGTGMMMGSGSMMTGDMMSMMKNCTCCKDMMGKGGMMMGSGSMASTGMAMTGKSMQ